MSKNPLEKIRKMLALAKDRSNPNAAMVAAQLASEWMLRFNISQEQVEAAEARASGGAIRAYKDSEHEYHYTVARAAAVLYSCIPITTPDHVGLQFFGRSENVQACEATYEMICAQIDVLFKAVSAKHWDDPEQFRREFYRTSAIRLFTVAEELMRINIDNSVKLLGCNALVLRDQMVAEAEAAAGVQPKSTALAVQPTSGALMGFRAAGLVKFHKEVKK